MIIKRIINNNFVLAEDQTGREKLLMGRGIAFGRSKGHPVDEALIERVYYSGENDYFDRVVLLLNTLPEIYFELVEEIIKTASAQLKQKLSHNLYLSLIDHIQFAVKRAKDGVILQNKMLWEIQKYYDVEYGIGMDSVKKINEQLNVNLDEHEAAFIALHLVNAQLEGNHMSQTTQMTELIHEIINIITYHYGQPLDEKSFGYKRFLTHLQFFIRRVRQTAAVPDYEQHFLFEKVRQEYVKAFKCSEKIKNYLERVHNIHSSEEEQTFLTIHIQRVAGEEGSR